MQKTIQVKLIHLLGGISEKEIININHESFRQGEKHGRAAVKSYLISLETQIYGKSKQDWIDIIHTAIKNL